MTYDHNKSLDISLSMQVEGFKPLIYDLSITPNGLAYAISHERLSQQQDPNAPKPFMHINSTNKDIKYYELNAKKPTRSNWEHNPLESSLSQVPKMYQEPEVFRRALASSTLYHALNVAPRSPVRLPQNMRPAGLPGKDGEDLVSCLYYLRETDRDRFEAVEDALRAAFPTFERLDFPPVAAGTLTMAWKDRNFTRPMYAHQLSEGTLRFLWLVTLLQSPNLPAVTLIDEPELGLIQRTYELERIKVKTRQVPYIRLVISSGKALEVAKNLTKKAPKQALLQYHRIPCKRYSRILGCHKF